MSEQRGAIVVVAQPKGGVGKSTAAWEIAHGFARNGIKACLVDGESAKLVANDGEETSTIDDLHTVRTTGPLKDQPSAAVVKAPTSIERTALDMARVHDLVVVDLGARDWARYTTLPTAADLWVIPTDFAGVNMRPAANLFSQHLWPMRHRRQNPLPVRLLFSCTPTHTTGNPAGLARALEWWSQAIEAVTELEPPKNGYFHPDTGFGVFSAQLRLRASVWDEAANKGATVSELPANIGGKAAAEVEQLLAEVHAALTGA